jgi:hypothetical protein
VESITARDASGVLYSAPVSWTFVRGCAHDTARECFDCWTWRSWKAGTLAPLKSLTDTAA